MILPLLLALIPGSARGPAPSAPKVADAKLAEIARFAEVIFVGRVEEVFVLEQPQEGDGSGSMPCPLDKLPRVRVAKVRVERALKGVEHGDVVHYLATSTWTCDISGATSGERALFLLDESDWPLDLQSAARAELKTHTGPAPSYRVAHFGRGSMPLRLLEGEEYAAFWSGVIMPDDLPTVVGLDDDYPSRRAAHLPSLEKLLAKIVLEQLPHFSLSHRHPLAMDRSWGFRVWGDGYARLRIDDPKEGAKYIESKIAPEHIAKLTAALRDASASSVSGSFGQDGPDGVSRILEAQGKDHSLSFELHTLFPESVQGNEDRLRVTTALKLWAELRALFDEPHTLDARERDRALYEGW